MTKPTKADIAPKRKRRQYDYIGELIEMMRGWKDIGLRKRMYRRVLRKLVREAVLSVDEVFYCKTHTPNEIADRIARELLP